MPENRVIGGMADAQDMEKKMQVLIISGGSIDTKYALAFFEQKRI